MASKERLQDMVRWGLVICACCCAGCSNPASDDARSATTADPRPSSQSTSLAGMERGALQDDRGETGGASYRIIKDEHLRNIKRSVDVRLPRAIGDADLERFAREIYAKDPGYDRTFIVWLLPGMEPGAGAWATTHFNPTLEVRVLGLSVEDSQSLITHAREQSGVEGRWLDQSPYIGGTILLRLIDGRLVVIHRFKDGSELQREVRHRRVGDARRLDPIEDAGEYYVIRANGVLEMHDEEGLIKSIDPL